jgi:hypothetical protein
MMNRERSGLDPPPNDYSDAPTCYSVPSFK